MRNGREMEKETEREMESGAGREAERTEGMRKAKRAGKARRAAVFAGMTLMLAMFSGCGESKQAVNEPEVKAASIDTGESEEVKTTGTDTTENGKEGENGASGQPEAGAGNSAGQDSGSQSDAGLENNASTDTGAAQQSGSDTQASDKVIGNIKSIGDNSVVISRAFEEASNILVSPAGDNEVLVTVFVSDATTYEVHTVKNGGVNGDADVEREEGSFSDCKENVQIDVFGSWDGDDFNAVSIIIYHFV